MATVPAAVTIDEAFDAFLAEQRARLSPKTFRRYEDVIDLLRSSLNGYAHNSLDDAEQKRWRAALDAGDDEAYCRFFGPEKIVDHLGEFLDWFMADKVIAGEELLRASGTVTKKLAAWLHEQGHITAEQRDAAARRGTRARAISSTPTVSVRFSTTRR